MGRGCEKPQEKSTSHNAAAFAILPQGPSLQFRQHTSPPATHQLAIRAVCEYWIDCPVVHGRVTVATATALNPFPVPLAYGVIHGAPMQRDTYSYIRG
jgi:hypothetical protein